MGEYKLPHCIEEENEIEVEEQGSFPSSEDAWREVPDSRLVLLTIMLWCLRINPVITQVALSREQMAQASKAQTNTEL